MAKVYDCFAFFNELDLLEIRLHELDPVVDHFVLVEATRTFQKQPKPLYYADNKERFKEFEHKIIHVVVDKYPNFFTKFRIPTAWDYDNHQKNQIILGLTNAAPDDVIIYSDLDEIPRADKVREYAARPGVKVFEQRFYSYFANCAIVDCPAAPELPEIDGQVFWHGSVMGFFRDFHDTKQFRMLRDLNEPEITLIKDGGWHFTYLGGLDSVIYKLRSFAHAKEKKFGIANLPDRETLENLLAQGKDLLGRDISYRFVPLDESFPAYLREHTEKYAHLVRHVTLNVV